MKAPRVPPCRDWLVSGCHCWSRARRQPHMNDEVQTCSHLSVEIRRARVVLSDVHTRIFGKTGALQVCSRTLGAAIGFTGCRHFTVFILDQWRPGGVEYSFQQLRKIFAKHLRSCRGLDSSVFLSAPTSRAIEYQSGLVGSTVGGWGRTEPGAVWFGVGRE